jgi:hypothetical protein
MFISVFQFAQQRVRFIQDTKNICNADNGGLCAFGRTRGADWRIRA